MRRANESSTGSGNEATSNIPTFDGNKNKFAPKQQNPNKKMAEKPTTKHQGTNAIAVPLSIPKARSAPSNCAANFKSKSSENSEDSKHEKLSTITEDIGNENEWTESGKHDIMGKDREDAKIPNEQSGNAQSKVVTELSVENEILKIQIESMKREINDWKERYKRCKLQLQQSKQR